MSERDNSTGTDTPEEMRPLPDGGLSDAMPDWLRRPPAWRDLPRKDEPAAEKTLPEPDTSVIDPRELVTVDDLPQWLRDIAARETEPEPASPVPADPEETIVVSAIGPEPASTPEGPTSAEPTEPVPSSKSGTLLWIWALRAAIILIILSIIYYVFIL